MKPKRLLIQWDKKLRDSVNMSWCMKINKFKP